MLKIIIIIIGYTLNNFTIHIKLVNDGKIYNFKIQNQFIFWIFIYFLVWKLVG
jgi:hypothetical protein